MLEILLTVQLFQPFTDAVIGIAVVIALLSISRNIRNLKD